MAALSLKAETIVVDFGRTRRQMYKAMDAETR